MSKAARFPPGFTLLLASQSPRRHSLLRDLRIPFSVVDSVAEEVSAGGPVGLLVGRNAAAKVQGAVLPEDMEPGAFVLGTDTLVAVGRRVLGKPGSVQEAGEMLAALSGRTHRVVSGVALARTTKTSGRAEVDRIRVARATTEVTFMDLDRAGIEAYLAAGEWKGKAGAYAIQGLAGFWVRGIKGEYSNVVGLPLHVMAGLFRTEGFDLVRGEWLPRGRQSVATADAQ